MTRNQRSTPVRLYLAVRAEQPSVPRFDCLHTWSPRVSAQAFRHIAVWTWWCKRRHKQMRRAISSKTMRLGDMRQVGSIYTLHVCGGGSGFNGSAARHYLVVRTVRHAKPWLCANQTPIMQNSAPGNQTAGRFPINARKCCDESIA